MLNEKKEKKRNIDIEKNSRRSKVNKKREARARNQVQR